MSILQCVTWFAVVTVALAEVASNGCKYELQVPEIKCNTVEIETKLEDVSAKQSVSEERLSAMATVFKDELTVLSNDVTGAKTVLTRLVEDSVQIQRRIRTLSDLGSDVVGLHKRVTNLNNDVAQKLTGLQNQVAQVEQASRSITSYISNQMAANKEVLTALRQELDAVKNSERTLLNKIAQIEQGGQSGGSNAQVGQLLRSLETLTSQLTALRKDFDAAKDATEERLGGVEGELDRILM